MLFLIGEGDIDRGEGAIEAKFSFAIVAESQDPIAFAGGYLKTGLKIKTAPGKHFQKPF